MKTTLLLEKASDFKKPLNPTAIISRPMLFFGRRPQKYSPVPMNPQPITSVNTA